MTKRIAEPHHVLEARQGKALSLDSADAGQEEVLTLLTNQAALVANNRAILNYTARRPRATMRRRIAD
jgi:hypothetical protein